jgi:hypothetical protein
MARPERREEIIAFGPRTVVSGTLSTWIVGAIVAMLG